MIDDVDVCVIGSGFGGGPVALRAAQSGASVAVLEQGRRYDGRPGSSRFRQTQTDFGYLMDLFQVSVGLGPGGASATLVLGGRGLGGGSLVYSMVSLRAPSFVFDDPVWPDGLDRTALDPYYDRVEQQLGVTQLCWEGAAGVDDWRTCSKRDAAFATMCERAGVSCDPVPSAINTNCGNLGWCTTGCIRHSKNSVDLRYMQPAEDLGARIHTGVQALSVSPAATATSRRWVLRCATGEVAADHVVLAAGAVGTPGLLLGSASALPGGISTHVGRNLSRGGDMLVPVVLPEDLGLDDMEMLPGKVIGSCSFQYLFEPPPGFGSDWPRFVLQPMMVLPMISALVTADPDGDGPDGDMRSFGEHQKHLMAHWGDRLLHIGVMGMDGMDGRVELLAGIPTVYFDTSEQTRALFAAARAAIHHVFDRGPGGRALPSFDELRPDSLALHPLGSARLADSVADGAVDPSGRVFRADGTVHDGLVVADASLMSSPIAVNTSLTTAALSEMVAERLLV